jgi:hypothetical protein
MPGELEPLVDLDAMELFRLAVVAGKFCVSTANSSVAPSAWLDDVRIGQVRPLFSRSGGAGNRKAAQALELTIPASVLSTADEVGYSRVCLERTKKTRLIARSLFVDNDI